MLGNAHPVSEVVAALNSVSLTDVQGWPRELLADVRMETFFSGNVFPWTAKRLSKVISLLLCSCFVLCMYLVIVLLALIK
jgi:hypothetical protein